MRAAASTSILRTLIAALPEDRLRALLLELLLGNLPAGAATEEPPTPAQRRRRGWPRGKRRGPRKAAPRRAAKPNGTAVAASARRRRAEKRAAQPATEQTAAERSEPDGAAGLAAVSAAMFWTHARKLDPARPWLVVAREFSVKEPVARNCYDRQSLPPQVGPMAITRFLDLQVDTR